MGCKGGAFQGPIDQPDEELWDVSWFDSIVQMRSPTSHYTAIAIDCKRENGRARRHHRHK